MTTEEIGAVRAALSADPSQFIADMKAAQAAVRGFASRASADIKTFETVGNATSGRFISRFGQVSLQLQDVAVQLGTGTNVMRIFAQQGSQVLSIFGPWGMIVGAAAAVVGTLATSMFNFGKSVEELPPGADAAATAIKTLNKSAEDYRDTLLGTTAAQRDFITGMQDFRGKMAQSNIGPLAEQIAGLKVNQVAPTVPGNLGEKLNALAKVKGDMVRLLSDAALSGDPNQVIDVANQLGLASTPGAGPLVLQLVDLAKEVASSKALDDASGKLQGLYVHVGLKGGSKAPKATATSIADSYRQATAEAQAFNAALLDGTGTVAVQAHYAVLNDIQGKNLHLTQAQIAALEELKRQQLYAAASRAELEKTAGAPGEASANARGAYRVAALGLDATKATQETTVQVQLLASASMQAADGIAGMFADLKDGAAGAISAVENLAASISDLIIKQLILAGIGTALNAYSPGTATTMGLPHFANGGSFRVGGTGGTDGQLVAFRATPGERVTVDQPGAMSRGGSGGGPTVYIDARGADAAGMRELQAQVAALHGSIEKRSVAANMAKGRRSVGYRKAVAG